MEEEFTHSVTISIEAPTKQQHTEYNSIIGKVLSVDREIDEKNVKKQIELIPGGVNIKIKAKELKLLRACVTGLMKHCQLVANTIKEFRDLQ